MKAYSLESLPVSISDGPKLPTVREYLEGSDESFSKTVNPFLARLSFAKVDCSLELECLGLRKQKINLLIGSPVIGCLSMLHL